MKTRKFKKGDKVRFDFTKGYTKRGCEVVYEVDELLVNNNITVLGHGSSITKPETEFVKA